MTDGHDEIVQEFAFEPLADSGLLLRFGTRNSIRLNTAIHHLARKIGDASFYEIEDIIPGYSTLLLRFKPGQVEGSGLRTRIAAFISQIHDASTLPRRLVELPVAYGGEFGPDIEEVSKKTGLSEVQIIVEHTTRPYYVYCLGFSAGFPYMGGLPTFLHCARRDSPRPSIPAGSVGIGGGQTGVYPQASPGGWQLVGRTPCKLFDASQSPPSILNPGDLVRFVPIDAAEYTRISRDQEENTGQGLAIVHLSPRQSERCVKQIEMTEAEGGASS